MKPTRQNKSLILQTALAALWLTGLAQGTVQAVTQDSFGSGVNAFSIDFVDVGNAGKEADTTEYGAVPYSSRMAVTEVPQNWIDKATNLGLANVAAGVWTGLQPAADITWYEAAAFVNWLNTIPGSPAAYDLRWTGTAWKMNLWSSGDAWTLGGQNLYRHTDAHYFLPSENEWYKAAYHQNNGVTANYWLYPTGSNTAPTPVASGTAAGTAVYNVVASSPANVDDDGGLSPYLTRGQGGNVSEWQESAFTAENDSPSENRVRRGGGWINTDAIFLMRSSNRGGVDLTASFNNSGFRVASVPEPSATMLMVGSGLMWLARRRHRSSL